MARTAKKADVKTAENKDITMEEKLAKANQDKEDMSKLVAQMQEQIKTLSEQMEKAKAEPIVIQQSEGLGSKKIKCINLLHNPLNVSTEQYGQGRIYSFDKYCDTRLIKFDDLADIAAAYPNTIEHGYMYICDVDAVKELGLEDEYKTIYTKEMINEISYLRKESDVDLFVGMDKHMQEDVAVEMARLFNANEFMDRNYLARIKAETGYDIEQMAHDIKEENTKLKEE